MGIVKLEDVSCNFCGSKDNRVIYKRRLHKPYYKEMFYPTSASFKSENIVKCQKCGLIFTNPRPPLDLLLQFYAEGKDQNYIEQQEERTETFRRALKFIESFCSGGNMLDIGCGAGFLLYAAKERHWGTKGIEPNRFFANFAKIKLQVDVINEVVERVELKPGSFDVIVMWDTLEHLFDPYLGLLKSYSWLKKNGYIFINIPDIDSIFAKVFRSKWWFIEAMHLYYFSPKTINMYFNKIGFKYLRKKPYIQTLKLGYLISKIRSYSDFFITSRIRLQNL